jgi:NTE family protein
MTETTVKTAPKTAIVLSGGGLFGAYQAGVWLRLSHVLRPDLVVGTSVGALNGWWIASGASAEGLAAKWLDPESAALTAWRPTWRGLLDRDGLRSNVRRLTEELTPVLPLGITLVEIPRLHSRLVRYPEITWQHLVASCSVPGGYSPARLNGRWLIDGGVLDSLPVWAAVEMGATRVIGVNVLAVAPSRLLRAAARTVRAVARERRARGDGLDIVRIDPSQALGTLRDTYHWRRENIERWIELGERDAEKAIGAGVLVP